MRLIKDKYHQVILLASLLSIYTFYLFTRCNITTDNLTYVANVLGYSFHFFIWTLFTALYYFLSIRILYQSVHLHQTFYFILHLLLCVLLVSSSLIPYDLNRYPILSSLHVDLTSISVIIYIFYLFIYLIQLSKYSIQRGRRSISYLIALILISILLFVQYGKITGLMELVLMIGLILFTLYLVYESKKEDLL